MHTEANNITIPSINVPKIPLLIIATGKILQFMTPSLATLFVIKLFRTPIRFKTPTREKMMAESAQKKMVLIPEINKEVMVYSYGYSKRKVLLIHGWNGRGTQLFKIADKLLENGFMTISFDAPAHGKSTGKTTMMSEFVETALFLEKQFGPFEIAIGHSLGAMTVLNSAKQGLNIKKAIVIGAGDIITDIIKEFVTKLQLKPKMINKIKLRFYKQFGEDIDNYSASTVAKKVKIPTLVLHDTEDVEVPVSSAHHIRKYLEQGEIIITNGLGHSRILRDPFVINRIIEFIKRND
ncbi:MAG: alpha/beta hydrolase [Lutibacter sp.]|jgi:pimeloyl-ACP methyl ester carboxylesterase